MDFTYNQGNISTFVLFQCYPFTLEGSEMQPLRKEKLTMLALALAGEKPLSKVQLQKAVFLFQEQLPEEVLPLQPPQRYQFVKYNYGAFAKDVYIDAYKLSQQGLATATPDSPVNFQTISATRHIANHISNVLRDMPFEVYAQAKTIVDWVLQQSFGTLVSEMYSQYPQYKEKSIFGRLAAAGIAAVEAGKSVFEASRYPEIVPELINAGYEVRDRLNVQRFLRENPFLVSLLYETIAKTQEYFPGASVRLELFQDPEAEEVSEHLFVRVGSEMEPREAYDKLRQLQSEWWLAKLPEARGQMTIGLDYL